MPTEEKCPQCGSMLMRKKGRHQLVCMNKECGYKRDEAPKEDVSDETVNAPKDADNE
jgi:ssDNA-binding Zn-finger/Zn-ribbon topoisomerase 1